MPLIHKYSLQRKMQCIPQSQTQMFGLSGKKIVVNSTISTLNNKSTKNCLSHSLCDNTEIVIYHFKLNQTCLIWMKAWCQCCNINANKKPTKIVTLTNLWRKKPSWHFEPRMKYHFVVDHKCLKGTLFSGAHCSPFSSQRHFFKVLCPLYR